MIGIKKIAGALVGALMAVSASSASAYVIDFTKSTTGTSGSLFGGSVTWTMTSSGILNNSQGFDGNWAPTGTGLAFETDGYGVGMNDDEITTSTMKQEWIEVTFSVPTLVNSFAFLDLFVARDYSSGEVGQVNIDGGLPITLWAQDLANSGSPGYVSTMIQPVLASVIRFTVLSSNDAYGFADGALAAIGIAPIPVPAAGLMLFGGLGGLAMLRRRKKA